MKRYICVYLFLCITVFVHAQPDTTTPKLTRFVKNIITFNKQYPQEKVYLHFDNTGYYLGETIWFKAYVVTAEEHLPTTLSRVLYVELLNPEGDVVITKKLKVENGQCHGDFQLKDSLFAGYYEVRAYTRYMLNFGKTEYMVYRPPSMKIIENGKKQTEWEGDYVYYTYPVDNYIRSIGEVYSKKYPAKSDCGINPFGERCRENETIFTRVFPVYNRPEKEGDYALKVMRERLRVFESNEKKIKAIAPFKVSFYPEGGNLVTGLSSKVTFKAISEQGENVDVKGVVKNNRGDEVCTLQTIHEGMGSFELTPDGTTYTAEVYYQNKVAKFDLPKPRPQGCVMTVNAMSSKKLIISLQQNETTASTVGITIGCRGKVLYYETLTIKNEEPTLLSVNKASLRTGVNQITIFDGNGKVLADRLVFINNEEYKVVTLSVKAQKVLYKPYEPIQLDFQLTDSLHQTSESNFSLAVRDAETEEFTYPAYNVLSNLLLSSDLKGYIANPAYYFESNDNAHRYAQDLLMLTQGWRRYEWKEMAGIDTFKLNQPLEKGIIIDGVVRDYQQLKTGVTNAYLKMSLTLPNKQAMDGEFKTDSLGRFYAFVGDFEGTGTLTMTAFTKSKGEIISKDYRIPLNRQFSPTPKPNYAFYQINIPYVGKSDSLGFKENIGQTELNNKVVNIKEVTVSGKRSKRRNIDFSRPNYQLCAANEIDKQIDKGFELTYSSGNVGSLCINSARVRGMGAVSVRIMLENNYYVVLGMIANLSASDVDSIYIYTDMVTRNIYASEREQLGGKVPDVVICVKSKEQLTKRDMYEGVRHTNLQGYSYVSEFYSPDYKNNALPEKKDFRRTLYWNPDVKTDNTGKAQVSFYNNSTCKRINISAETVTNNGVPVVVNN